MAIYGHIWAYTTICGHILPYIYIYIYIYIKEDRGIWASYALLLLHGGARVFYIAIYGRIWLYMLIYALKYAFWVVGYVFCMSELIF